MLRKLLQATESKSKNIRESYYIEKLIYIIEKSSQFINFRC